MILIGANQDSVFGRLCDAMQQSALADDDRYRDHESRGENQHELDVLIGSWSKTLSSSGLCSKSTSRCENVISCRTMVADS